MAFSIMTIRINDIWHKNTQDKGAKPNNQIWSVTMLNILTREGFSKCSYSECHYAERIWRPYQCMPE